jgi:hypothetical protein
MTHREHIAPLISNIIDSIGKKDMKVLRAALRHAYPCGERKYWPYKVWCDEIRSQLGLKKHRTKTDANTKELFQ